MVRCLILRRLAIPVALQYPIRPYAGQSLPRQVRPRFPTRGIGALALPVRRCGASLSQFR